MTLKQLAQSIPPHVVNSGFALSKQPVGGDWFIYSDDGLGMGRQHIAIVPADRHYFGPLAEFMAAAHPAAILSLYARIEAAEAGMEPAIAEAERRGREAAALEARQNALVAAWAAVESEPDHVARGGAYRTAQAIAKAGCV